MTRLTDALNKARAAKDNAVPVNPVAAQEAPEVVPTQWTFEEPAHEAPGTEIAGSPAAAASGAPAAERRGAAETAETYPFARSPRLIVGPSPDPTLVEQYRHLAAALHHTQSRTGAKSVMIASAVEAEGKTTTAANVALTLSHSYGRRVLLIDADLRRPSTHSLFELSNRQGLSDVLRGRIEGGKLPIQQLSSNLWVLVAGRPDLDPMRGLVSETMRQVLVDAMEEFDWVVVDTPPVALLTDANLLAAFVDVALLVVSANTTPYPLVKRAMEAIGPERILGVVLNRARRSDMVGGYGYGYKYSYGRPRVEKRRGLLRFTRKSAG